MAKRKVKFGKVNTIRSLRTHSKMGPIVPKRRPERLDACDLPMYPAPDNGTLANLARKIPNADVFAYYKSAYRRWSKASEIYADYEGSQVINDEPYRNFYFKSCDSTVGFWKVSYLDNGLREFGVDTSTSVSNDFVFNGGEFGPTDGQGFLYVCEGVATYGDEEEVLPDGETEIIEYPEVLLCSNGSCIQGEEYVPFDDPTVLEYDILGLISYPQTDNAEVDGLTYQETGTNLFYILEKELTNPVVLCDTTCTVSTDYGASPKLGLIEWGRNKQYLAQPDQLPLSFLVEPVGGGYEHTWDLLGGCEGVTTYSTDDLVTSFTVENDPSPVPGVPAPASPGVDYCAGSPQVDLNWSSGSQSTVNTPISYALTTSGIGSISIPFNSSSFSTSNIPLLAGESYVLTASGIGSYGPADVDSAFVFRPATNSWELFQFEFEGSSAISSISWNESFNAGHDYTATVVANSDGFIKARFADSIYGDNSGSVSWVITKVIPSYTLTITDNTGTIATYDYTTEPTDFTVTCYALQDQWTLNFQPQNQSFVFDCEPTNVVTNTGQIGGCCDMKSSPSTRGSFTPPSGINCAIDPYTDGAPPAACHPPGSIYLGYYEAPGGEVTTFYRFDSTEPVGECIEYTYKISIFANGVLVQEDEVCGDPTDTVKISEMDGIVYTLYVGVNGIVLPPLTYNNYDPTSNPELFYIKQLPYSELIDAEGNPDVQPPGFDFNYQCTIREFGSNGPFTVDVFFNQILNKWQVNILDADGNIISTEFYDSEPSINNSNPDSPVQVNTLNQDPYLTCTCPDHDRKILYYDPDSEEEGFTRDWSGANGAGAPNILGTRCCKHVFSVLNQLGVSDLYKPEDFPTDPVPEKFQDAALIGEEFTDTMKFKNNDFL